jgi:predicted nucleic-acid-binding protein
MNIYNYYLNIDYILMYQVNYKGLRRRESYDEVVSIIENDQTKIKYPNRVAVQILNSPYMKQLDTEALMDMQNQQDRMSKNKMKQLVMQELASQTGTPFVQMRAQHDPARQAGVMRQLKSDSDYQEALDDRAERIIGVKLGRC